MDGKEKFRLQKKIEENLNSKLPLFGSHLSFLCLLRSLSAQRFYVSQLRCNYDKTPVAVLRKHPLPESVNSRPEGATYNDLFFFFCKKRITYNISR